jgi:hypothetical protein
MYRHAMPQRPRVVRKANHKGARPWRIATFSLYLDVITRMDKMVATLKRRGHTSMNKSMLVREAIDQLDISKIQIPDADAARNEMA